MLPHENEPFADAHIENLENIREELGELIETVPGNTIMLQVPMAKLLEWRDSLRNTKNGFYRYKVCFADEVKQKERLAEKALHCRLNHK